MAEDGTTTEDARRAELIDRIWKFKLVLQHSDGTYFHFKLCLDDEDYRRKVLQNALDSGDPETRRQAQAILAMDFGGTLLRRPVRDAEFDASGSGGKPPLPAPEPAVVKTGASLGSHVPEHVPGASATAKRSGNRGVAWLMLALVASAGVAWLAINPHLLPRGIPMPGFMVSNKVVSGSILESTLWRAERPIELDGLVFVEGGARLTIEPGTIIRGRPGSALIVTRDAAIHARGSASQPIVFTSSQPAGERRPGDWGGLVMLGNAPINRVQAQIEGIEETDSRGSFGGSDRSSNCGVLEYVRIEFAGFEIGANNELNGLTLGGCGDSTVVRNVQSHRGKDDGIEVFGGTVDLRNIVVSGASDDSFDWDMGWTGRVQFLVIQQYAEAGDNGFEGDNWGDRHDAEPRSRPQFHNVTMIGSGDPNAGQRAMTIRHGSGGIFRNFIITGFPLEAIDLRGDSVGELVESGALEFSHMMLHDIGAGGVAFFAEEAGEADDDGGFNETAYFAGIGSVYLGVDPRLGGQSTQGSDFGTVASLIPSLGSPAGNGVAPTSEAEFWDRSAVYMGAFRPGERTGWMQGWTAFPEG